MLGNDHNNFICNTKFIYTSPDTVLVYYVPSPSCTQQADNYIYIIILLIYVR